MYQVILALFNHPLTFLFLRVIIGIVFLISSIGKIIDHKKFIQIVINYEILSPSLSLLYGFFLPYIELIIAIMIILGLFVDAAGYVGILMILSFIYAVSVNVVRGRKNLDCGCFGKFLERKLGLPTLLDDIVILLLSFVLIFSSSRFLSLDLLIIPGTQGATYPIFGDVLPFLMSVLLLFGLYILIKQFTLNIGKTKR